MAKADRLLSNYMGAKAEVRRVGETNRAVFVFTFGLQTPDGTLKGLEDFVRGNVGQKLD